MVTILWDPHFEMEPTGMAQHQPKPRTLYKLYDIAILYQSLLKIEIKVKEGLAYRFLVYIASVLKIWPLKNLILRQRKWVDMGYVLQCIPFRLRELSKQG